MAKRRRKGFKRARTRTRTVVKYRSRAVARPRRRSRRSGGGGGRLVSFLPSKDKLIDIGMAGAYGYLEGAAKADTNHFLNKIPKPIEALGFAGGVALAAYIANHFALKNKWLEHFANGAASAQLYIFGRYQQAGTKGTATQIPTVSGDDISGLDELMGDIDGDDLLGDIDGDDMMEGIEGDEMSGLDVTPDVVTEG